MKKLNKFYFILLGFPKSLYFNLKYFGIKGIKCPILLSHRVVLSKVAGRIRLKEWKTGIVMIGFPSVGIFDYRYSRSIWQNEGEIIFNGKTSLGQGIKISVSKSGILNLGNNFIITAETQIICFKKISFGNNCLISWENLFMDTDFHKIYEKFSTNRINNDRDIKIGDDVWIGCKNTILKGTTISNMSIIGSNSLISSKYLEENIVIAGNPSKVLKKNVIWRK